MKKILISAVLVMGACAYAEGSASAQYDDWFTGIGQDVTDTTNMKSTNASWDFAHAGNGATIEGGKLVLDLGENESVVLTPVADKAPDTNTVTKVTVTTTLAPVAVLPEASEMDTAQSAIAICNGKYYAWNGIQWEDLGAASVVDGAEVALVASFSYQDMNSTPVRKVTFSVGNTTIGTVKLETTANALESVTCKGAGTIAQIEGDVMLGVAEANETKFGTVGEAIDEAKKLGEKNVVLLRDTDEIINDQLSGGVKIDFNGKVAGSSDTTREAYDQNSDGKIAYQPTALVMGSVTGGGQPLTANLAKLRKFMRDYNVQAYNASPAVANDITAELAVDNTTSKRPLWESYVLGIEPLTVLTLEAVPKDGMVAIPEINDDNFSGDYVVSYKIGETDGLSIPTTTGEYTVKIILTPKGN